jgi:hypothetical protein
MCTSTNRTMPLIRKATSCLVLFTLMSATVRGQSTAPARDSTKLAVIHDLLTMTHAVDQAITNMDATIAAQRAANPRIPAVFWDRFLEQARAHRGDLEVMIADAYDRHLSVDDLRQLLAFYQTPVGRKVLAELPGIMQESFQAGQTWGEKLGASVAAQLEKEGVRIPPPL